MLTLGVAVFIASLLGSMHCVGMCGPLALWATAGGTKTTSIAAYHAGRLTTYLTAGLIAGVVGTALTIGGDLAGFQSLAARFAGGVLIFAGLLRLFQRIPFFQRPPKPLQTGPSDDPVRPSRVAALLQKAKPLIAGMRPSSRAYFGGLLTTWLPCGWLYLFVLVAAGTGGVVPSLWVMTAFWVGTLPALTTLLLGAQKLTPRLRGVVPIAAGVLLIVAGLYTATGRAAADLSAVIPPPRWTTEDGPAMLRGLAEQPMPCCEPEISAAAP